jgi:hypothetical protein
VRGVRGSRIESTGGWWVTEVLQHHGVGGIAQRPPTETSVASSNWFDARRRGQMRPDLDLLVIIYALS